jgi:NTP pyrophosphatase (non-canonical NTP hydrolase)
MSYGEKSITDWVDEITAWGKRKGWDKPALCKTKGLGRRAPKGVDHNAVLAKLMLVVTELAEAAEEVRDDKWSTYYNQSASDFGTDAVKKPEGFVTEMADAVIRIFHLAGLLGLDLESAIREKMAYNETRSHRHGGRKA